MGNTFGENIRLTIFGQSHAPAIGMTLEGIPAGSRIDFEALRAFMKRRAPGQSALSTARREADEVEFLCGLIGDTTCGAPLTAIIRNTDRRSRDYDALRQVPRPGHADYTAYVKYAGHNDIAGGGQFSGRLTAPLCIAGGILKQLLEKEHIHIFSRIRAVGGIEDEGVPESDLSEKPFPTVSDARGEEMQQAILAAAAEGDSLGGVIECIATGVPAGLGDPMFDGMENRIAQLVFAIPAVKGIEFGAGFEAAKMRGSENNDAFIVEKGQVKTQTNHAGGILGGITDGMPLTFRAAIKPTPSIGKPQQSIRLDTLGEAELTVGGRHDPCIVPRALPCIEAAAAIALYDAYLQRRLDRE